ncbi:MAG: response regulator transcription factor [Bacteroidota bacterium]
MKKIRIVIIDDHDMVRQSLASMLETFDRYEIVGTVHSGKEGLKMVEELRPDLAIIDIIMPDINGIEVAKKIKHNFKEVKVLMLSMEVSSDYVKSAFQSDVDGYLPKNADIKLLVEAIDTIVSGKKYYDERIKEYIFKFFVGEESLNVPRIDALSDREVQVLKQIAEGVSNSKIGEMLFISPKTVEAHRNNILKKLNLHSTADLVKFAIAKNLTSIPKDMSIE